MDKLRRYDAYGCCREAEHVERADGKWCEYDDVANAIAARDARIAELEAEVACHGCIARSRRGMVGLCDDCAIAQASVPERG